MSVAQHGGEPTFGAEEDGTTRYLQEIAAVPRLSAAQEVALGERIAHGDREALRRMVEANLRLVVSVAKHYHSETLTLLDLVQEGNVGLIGAAQRYDPTMGYRFSTYAMWWIRRAVSRAVAFQGQMIRVPVRTGEGRAPSFPSHDHVEQGPLPGRVPVQDHPGSASSEPARKPQQPLSLDGAATDEYGPPLADFLEDRAVLSPVEEAEQQLLHERLVALLGALPTPERLVVELRYGLIDGQPRTLREVGSALGLTRERIRQLEIRALQRLRENDRAGELRAYLQQ